MDGNGRWAHARGLKRSAGHRRGFETMVAAVTTCRKAGVPYLTLFAFSTDNWRRSQDEIAELLQLFDEGLRANCKKIKQDNVRIRFLGDLSLFPKTLRSTLDKLETVTATNTELNLQIALNYSGRWDIAEAVRRLADTGMELSEITEEQIATRLSTAGLPEPDLVIRTSGELRLSNFMLWQAAYAELYFLEVLWPDFGPEHLQEALAAYAQRERRFGGIPSSSQPVADLV